MPFTDYRTALVTGANTGMGAAITEMLDQAGPHRLRPSPATPSGSTRSPSRTGMIPLRRRHHRHRGARPRLRPASRSTSWSTTPGCRRTGNILDAPTSSRSTPWSTSTSGRSCTCAGCCCRGWSSATSATSSTSARSPACTTSTATPPTTRQRRPCTRSPGSCATTYRQAGPGHRDLPGPSRDRDLRPQPRRHARSAAGGLAHLLRGLRVDHARGHRRHHRVRPRRPAARQPRPHRDPAHLPGARRPRLRPPHRLTHP